LEPFVKLARTIRRHRDTLATRQVVLSKKPLQI